jgi:cardiolipin synthase (CMP-forming)
LKTLNWANRITLSRLLLIVPFTACMVHINEPRIGNATRYAALAMFVFMAASDGIDGWLARNRGMKTKLGAFLDPLADKLLMTTALLLLASETAGVTEFRVPLNLVIIVIGKDLLLALGFVVQYFITQQIRIVPVIAGKAGTFVQLAMVLATLIGPEMMGPAPWWHDLVKVMWWASGAAAVWSLLAYVFHGIRFIEQVSPGAAKGTPKK